MKQAMIFAAGLGTRLKPLTDKIPKALVPVGGVTLLEHVITRLKAAGYVRIVVNVHHFASQIVDFLAANDNFGVDIRISDESEQLLETGGGVRKAIPLFADDEPVLIHNVDILDNVDYNWFARQHLSDEDAVLLVSRRATSRYLIFDNAMRLMGWTNTTTGEIKSPYEWMRTTDGLEIDSNTMSCRLRTGNSFASLSQRHSPNASRTFYLFAFSGIHSFSPRLFPLMQQFPDRFSIIDFYLQTCHRAKIVGCVKNDLKMIDVGKLDSLDRAEKFLVEG